MVITPANRFQFLTLGVDSGQMAVAPLPAVLNPDFDESSEIVAVIRVRPNATVHVHIDMSERDRSRTARMVVSTSRMSHGDDWFKAGDDGVIVVADPCYFLTGDVEFDASGKVTSTDDYSRACDVTCNPDGDIFGQFELSNGLRGFCTSTGYGDGGYRTHIGLDEEGFAETVEVTFIEDEDDDDDDSWDDDADSEE